MQKKLYTVCFKKAPHLSNIIDPVEPTLKKKFQVSAAFISREEQREKWRWSPHTSQLSVWWHGWHNWEALLCPLLYRLTVPISLTQLITDSCQNYSDAKCVNWGWEWRIEKNFLSVNQPRSDRSWLKFTSLVLEAYQSTTYASFIFYYRITTLIWLHEL